MRKSHLLLGLLTVMLALLGTATLSSCGDDDENGESENAKGKTPWISGLVRGFFLEYFSGIESFTLYSSAGLLDFSSGIMGMEGGSMLVADFRKDGTVLYYNLKETKVADWVKKLMQDNQGHIEPVYEGSWTQFEGHPEWSYFNGRTINRQGELQYEYVTPKKYNYSLDLENNRITVTDDEGKEWGTLYANFNPSKTSWSELRNESGKLMFVIWDESKPLDNSMFE